MPPVPLTVHNAQVTTATVEIKTLTVGGRQVTLAVFRQLRERTLVSSEGDLFGQPWGTVNYHPDRCGAGERTHLHVVWQHGEELLRARVDQPEWWRARFYSEIADEFVTAAACQAGHQRPEWLRYARSRDDGEECFAFTLDGMQCETTGRQYWHPASEPCRSRAEFEETGNLLRADVTAEHARRERVTTAWRALAELPQLFIAV